MARDIASTMVPPTFDLCRASVVKADGFDATALLPAHALFIGCGAPSPPSFAFIEILLHRINLAGRPCGIFSPKANALRYLSSLVRTAEASVGRPMPTKGGRSDEAKLENWIKNILARGARR